MRFRWTGQYRKGCGSQRLHTHTSLHSARGGFKPADLKELVRCVQQAESENRSIKAQGSGYSLSRAAVADHYLICTDGLRHWLSLPVPAVAKTIPRWFREGHRDDHLARLVRPSILSSLPDDAFLVHVEAGIKIKHLLAELDMAGLALSTMGAGGGQSLAGAISTGTHGSDFLLPPLSDFVRAIHLVGPGGQEWWIEPSAGLSTGGLLKNLPGSCPDTKVVRDDDWFRAPIVSVGRCGVIYSVVLQVTKQFKLLERSDLGVPWSSTKTKLRASSSTSVGVFLKKSPESDEPLRFF